MILKCFTSINPLKSHCSIIIPVLKMRKLGCLEGKYLAKIQELVVDLGLGPKQFSSDISAPDYVL